jgi:hypothetical protein
MMLDVINPPMPRTESVKAAPKTPVELVAFTRSLGAANVQGVIVVLSEEVRWMQRKGIL